MFICMHLCIFMDEHHGVLIVVAASATIKKITNYYTCVLIADDSTRQQDIRPAASAWTTGNICEQKYKQKQKNYVM